MTLDIDKAELRRKAMERRDGAHSTEASRRLCSRLVSYLDPVDAGAVIAGYLPIRSEVDPRPAMGMFAGKATVCVPVVVAAGKPLEFMAWHPHVPLVPGPYGTLHPEEGAPVWPDILLVPLLAFDRRGHRLGYGGGFYDRTIAALSATGPRPRTIGLAYSAQEVREVPIGPHDAGLDAIVTEADVIRPR